GGGGAGEHPGRLPGELRPPGGRRSVPGRGTAARARREAGRDEGAVRGGGVGATVLAAGGNATSPGVTRGLSVDRTGPAAAGLGGPAPRTTDRRGRLGTGSLRSGDGRARRLPIRSAAWRPSVNGEGVPTEGPWLCAP